MLIKGLLKMNAIKNDIGNKKKPLGTIQKL